jgi:hypothetical protein
MAALDVLPYPLLELFESPRLGRLLEQRLVHILRGIAAGSANYDPLAFLLPLQDGARADAKPPADFLGYGDLALCGEL